MLLSLHDRVKGSKWLGTTVIVVISIPFALFGIGSYLGGGVSNYAAKVNDEEISIRSYEQNYFVQRNRLLAAFGGTLPSGFDSASFLRRQALESSIVRTLLSQHIASNGYAIDDNTLANQLYEESVFQENGQFSKARYERQLQSQNLTAQQYEEQLRQDLTASQMSVGILSSAFQTRAESMRIAALQKQIRTFTGIEIGADAVGILEPPTETSIKAYFTANISQFQHPQKVKLGYMELSQMQLAATVSVDEDDLYTMYLDEKSRYVLPERRAAAHILIALNEGISATDEAEKKRLIESLRERVLAGEEFAELAKVYSEDPGSSEQGGDLGTFPRGVMVPAFEQVVFAMQVGEISEVVKSDFGFHLIQLNKIIAEQGKSFMDAKAEVEQIYREREAEVQFFELVENLANLVYENSDTLEVASESLGIEVVETDWLEAGGNEDIFRYPAVEASAFSNELITGQLNSEVLEVGDNHVVVLRVLEHQTAKAKTLDEVRVKIRDILVTQQREEKLKSIAEEALTALNDGDTLARVAVQTGGDLGEEMSVSRKEEAVDANIVRELFKMPKPVGRSSYSTTRTLAGTYVVIALSAVVAGDAGSVASERDQLAGRGEYAAWSAMLRARANVIINKQLLDDISAQR